MEASLAVPTATSVRVVPAKLLEVNRRIANNHLPAPAAGQGQLHPPHRLGHGPGRCAVPVDERRLRRDRRQAGRRPPPARQPRPRRRPREVRRHPHPPGPEHQGGRHPRLRRLLRRLRGPHPPGPRRQAHRRRLRRHDRHAHQPGHDRHRALGPPPHARPGRDHRRGRHRLPRRVPGRRPPHARPPRAWARSSRSPRPTTTASSRAPRRASSSARSTAPAGRGGLLRRGLRQPRACPTSRPAGGRHQPRPRAEDQVDKQARVLQLINMYRVRGHLIADLDPLGRKARPHATSSSTRSTAG